MDLNTIKERKRECIKKFGIDYDYVPSKNKKNVKFILKDCKKIQKTSKRDAYTRYYVDVHDNKTCDDIKGYWDKNAIHRVQKNKKGVCWVTDDDRTCSQKYSNNYVNRPLISFPRARCNADNMCRWIRSENDCFTQRAFEVKKNLFILPPDIPINIRTPEYARFIKDYYNGKKIEKPPKTTPINGTGNRCVGDSASTVPLLSTAQSIVNITMKVLCRSENKNRGLLVWHSTGSGKLCTAVGAMEAFWESPYKIIFCTSVEALNSNPPFKFYDCALKYFNRFTPPENISREEQIKYIETMFRQRKVMFMTFAQLAHYLLIANPLKSVKTEADKQAHRNLLQNSLLVIDEVQNIFKPLPTQKKENTAIKELLLDIKNPVIKNLKLLILTATPGDTPVDVADLLNMVRDLDVEKIKVPDLKNKNDIIEFTKKTTGLVSYLNLNSDYSKFPRVVDDEQSLIKIPMSMQLFKDYAEKYHSLHKNHKDFDKLMKNNELQKYYGIARRYSNQNYNYNKNDLISTFSHKIPIFLDKIKFFSHDKHYIYSSFFEKKGNMGQGALMISKFLIANGYEMMDLSKAREINKTDNIVQDKNAMIKNTYKNMMISKKPRFILGISSLLNEGKAAAGLAGKNLDLLRNIFNSPENKKGEYIHIFIASQGYNEGVDLKAVKHIHIFEPLVTEAMDVQTIGRAARMCSHSQFSDMSNWKVRVHRYFSEYPTDIKNIGNEKPENIKNTIDDVQKNIDDKNRDLNEFKGKRGEEIKQKRETIKNSIEELKKNMKELKVTYKSVKDLDLANLKMVDSLIYQESHERHADINNMYTIMKKGSIN